LLLIERICVTDKMDCIIFTKRNYNILLLGTLAALMYAAFYRQLLVDDAFISFRYARNLVDGFGLVWNPGEFLEGYTNFLWVMIVAAGMKLGLAPERFTYLLAIPLHMTGLVTTYYLARHVFSISHGRHNEQFSNDSDHSSTGINSVDIYSLLVLIWVGTNKSLFCFATSGLETPLQFALFPLIALLTVKSFRDDWGAVRIVSVSLIMNIALLSRLDSAMIILPVLLIFFHRIFYTKNYFTGLPYRSNLTVKSRLKYALLMIAPIMLISLPWLIWKLTYYHRLLPNSFYAKVNGLEGVGFGFFYLYIFLTTNFLIPYLLLVGVKYKMLARLNSSFAFISGLALIWVIYLVVIGGDFMEFRLFIHILPFIGISIIYTLLHLVKSHKVLLTLIAGMMLGNINSFFTIEKTVVTYGIEKAESLAFHLTEGHQNWVDIGVRLKEIFGGSDVSIAVAAAGAIPYYSGLPSVDYLGLCDIKIPEIGTKLSIVPGHRIIAPLEYIFDRRVNFLIDPINYMVRNSSVRQWIRTADWRHMDMMHLKIDELVHGNFVEEATWIVIVINEEYSLLVWYITPDPVVDDIIRKHGFQRFRLRRPR